MWIDMDVFIYGLDWMNQAYRAHSQIEATVLLWMLSVNVNIFFQQANASVNMVIGAVCSLFSAIIHRGFIYWSEVWERELFEKKQN